ncbi:unnamed protein product (macronuclear) [Paramecium tetraurelia]|uniref:Tubby C-terminal domain-containing protein n=1 Tax=Paramecium tetraurelia TaxID=5888 RepID=A0DNS7_PARTE|nr:uncharacterized protein GSPATT00018890001 [Paramecium tetraurelia]CAK84694.1 unnamed protein product [Paramecium tetraurelia]|eukprot:XP_001452091.1 hypothetical protein (macronuclear) [Paramecium tetraurelia strain d4-2]
MSDIMIENQDDIVKQNIIAEGHDFENSSEQRLPTLMNQSSIPSPVLISEYNPTNTDLFLNTPVPKGITLECDVKIIKGWFGLHTLYNFYHSKTKQLLLQVRKQQCPGSHKFQLSKSETELDLVGTLESNFIGTEFILYSKGLSHKNTNDLQTLRQELAFIQYEYQILKTRRNLFKVFIPSLIEGQPYRVVPQDENTGLKIKRRFKNKRNDEYFEFQTQEPVWSSKLQSFILPFNSRVNSASIHNFLLNQLKEDDRLSKDIAIQFGKCDNKLLNIDIAYPFTPLQAFSIIISQLDNKLLV